MITNSSRSGRGISILGFCSFLATKDIHIHFDPKWLQEVGHCLANSLQESPPVFLLMACTTASVHGLLTFCCCCCCIFLGCFRGLLLFSRPPPPLSTASLATSSPPKSSTPWSSKETRRRSSIGASSPSSSAPAPSSPSSEWSKSPAGTAVETPGLRDGDHVVVYMEALPLTAGAEVVVGTYETLESGSIHWTTAAITHNAWMEVVSSILLLFFGLL